MVRFRLVASDPPWKFGDSLPGRSRGASKNYRCIATSELCDRHGFVLPDAAEDSILLLWRVGAMQEDALRVARAWGFDPKGEIVWVKTRNDKLSFGMGRVFRGAHETCLVATRGKSVEVVVDHSMRSVFFAPVGRHSEKPDEFYRIAERLTGGPRAEMFARKRRPGWTQFGDELPALETGFQEAP